MTASELNYMIVAALALVRTEAGVLLVQQNIGRQAWGVPGGHVDRNETVEQAAIRELREETGFTVALGRVVGFYTVPAEQALSVVFEATITGGALRRVTNETADCRFFPPDQMPEEFRPHHHQRVLDFLRGGALPVFRLQA